MPEEQQEKVRRLLEDMRSKGNLPAISENVRDISHLTQKDTSGSVDLASIIMRDAGLTTNILATANSVIYSPRFPIRTVSFAVTFLGFDKVRSLALGLSMFKQTMKSAKNKKLGALYASSYFSGSFAQSLAKEKRYGNPEEIFVAGLLYRLPWLALANSYPDKFQQMEELIREKKLTTNQACSKIFEVDYNDLCKGLTEVYNLPESVASVLADTGSNDPIVSLIRESGHISNMLFGTRMGGVEAMKEIEKRISDLLKNDRFELAEFIKGSCKQDQNISRFFNMDGADVDMMVKACEWGKGNPAEISAGIRFGKEIEEEVHEDPDVLIGQFITELMMCNRKKEDINQVLMLAQEGIYRCLPHSEVFTCFLNRSKTALVGRFYTGSRPTIKPNYFNVTLKGSTSPMIRSMLQKDSGSWDEESNEQLGAPHIKSALKLTAAIHAPIIVNNVPIGMYFVGRSNGAIFEEKEKAWLDHIVSFVSAGFQSKQ